MGLILSAVLAGVFYFQSLDAKAQHKAVMKRMEGPAHRLSYNEARAFPWEFDLKSWEGRKVEVEGYFRYSRFMVARKRNGKDGYLIFAPFTTAANQTNPACNPLRKVEITAIVCLGWVPKELKNKIEDNDTPLPLTEFSEETHPGYLLIEDGFNRDLAQEDLYVPLTKLTAYVRPGESRNILKGYNNWPSEQHYKFIDLFYIARWFRSTNIDMTSVAYLERVVPSEEEAEVLPIPITEDEAQKLHAAQAPSTSAYVAPAALAGLASGLAMLFL